MRAINLLPRDDVQQRRHNLPALAATALIVLTSGLVGVFYFTAKSTAEANALELQDVQAELRTLPSAAEIEKKTAPQRKFAGEHEARVAALAGALTHRVAWDRVLRQVALVLPDDVWLQGFSAKSPTPPTAAPAQASSPGAPPTLLSIEGVTYSHDAVARLLTRLSVVPDLTNVWLESSSLGELGGRRVVNFRVLADVRPAGATS